MKRHWADDNQRFLAASLGSLRATLDGSAALDDAAVLEAEMEYPPALRSLCDCFGLSAFERDILLLCAGMELDSAFATYCPRPSFSFALARLQAPHWSAVAPSGPLRRWRLVELGSGPGLTASPLRIDERILHYLTGLSYVDERLKPYVEMAATAVDLPASQRVVAGKVANALKAGRSLVQLIGNDDDAKIAVASHACGELGFQLHTMRGSDIPSGVIDRDTLARLWEREALLHRGALLVHYDAAEARTALPFLESVGGPVLVASREPARLRAGRSATMEVNRPAAAEQREAWLRALGPLAEHVDGYLQRVVGQFDFGWPAIHDAGNTLDLVESTEHPGEALWEICRRQSRPRLDDLAQRITGSAEWNDLVLPEEQIALMRTLAAHVRNRFQVYETWGFSKKGSRGLGISAMFAGASGTGKTMAAEVLATELRLDLYRIDLSTVVSKYIGETEKNLRRVFDAAEDGGSVLLFDEADALFGKRSEVKDSHDRYANVEVSYLLQRMEAYRGLAILTTNMKTAIDPAFLRRIRFVVQFPFPDAEHRSEIWRRIFPTNTPTDGLDYTKLGRLSVSGGSIRNIALNAAFLAADQGAPVRMDLLLEAARQEYAKLEKPMAASETGGWTA
jgi:hypothetical protein